MERKKKYFEIRKEVREVVSGDLGMIFLKWWERF